MYKSESEEELDEFNEEQLQAAVKKFDWSDVPPIPQLPNTLYSSVRQSPCAIYFHYLQHLCGKNELSARTMALTQYLLILCTSNYYASLLRLNCIKFDPSHIPSERKFNRYLLTLNNREYQLWHFRKELQPQLHRAQQLQMIEQFLAEDSKNYHVWSYLTWLTESIGNYEEQFERINTQLTGDNFRKKQCYSLWSYRRWLIEKTGRNQNIQFMEGQVKWLCSLIRQNPTNQCLWTILNGYGKDTPEIVQVCSEINNRFSLYTQYLMNKNTEKGLEILRHLEETDLPRKNYWKYLQETDKYQ